MEVEGATEGGGVGNVKMRECTLMQNYSYAGKENNTRGKKGTFKRS